MKMDINQALEQLAIAFNTTVDKLYPILIKQAYVSAVTSIITVIVMVVIWVAMYHVCFKKVGITREGPFNEFSFNSFVTITVFGVYSVIAMIGVIVEIYSIPTALLNPEYWALKQILDAIRPVS